MPHRSEHGELLPEVRRALRRVVEHIGDTYGDTDVALTALACVGSQKENLPACLPEAPRSVAEALRTIQDQRPPGKVLRKELQQRFLHYVKKHGPKLKQQERYSYKPSLLKSLLPAVFAAGALLAIRNKELPQKSSAPLLRDFPAVSGHAKAFGFPKTPATPPSRLGWAASVGALMSLATGLWLASRNPRKVSRTDNKEDVELHSIREPANIELEDIVDESALLDKHRRFYSQDQGRYSSGSFKLLPEYEAVEGKITFAPSDIRPERQSMKMRKARSKRQRISDFGIRRKQKRSRKASA